MEELKKKIAIQIGFCVGWKGDSEKYDESLSKEVVDSIMILVQSHTREVLEKKQWEMNGVNADSKHFGDGEYNENQELMCRIGALTTIGELKKAFGLEDTK